MFRFMIQKIRHKKWLVLCMLIGNILLVAVAAGYPMYKEASLQRMLSDEFDNYQETTGVYPGLIKMTASAMKGELMQEFLDLEDYAGRVLSELSLRQKEWFVCQNLSSAKAVSNLVRAGAADQTIKIASMTNLPMHSEVVLGRMYEDSVSEDGFLEAVVTEACFVEKNMLLEEEFTCNGLKDSNGDPIKIRIVGVIKNNDKHDLYWMKKPDEYRHETFISEQLFTEWFRGDQMGRFSVNGSWYVLGDCASLQHKDAQQVKDKAAALLDISKVGISVSADGLSKVLAAYTGKEKKIEATLIILQVPVFALLAAFLFMISGQMLSMEQNEISQLKSRGASRMQIIGLYFMQNLLLAGVALFIGFPLGIGLCKILGSSTAFLEFGSGRLLHVRITGEAVGYAAGALLVSVFLTLIPVVRYSGVSIVHVKQKKSQNTKKFWQRLYLDVLITGIALYGYYSFSGRMEELKTSVAAGKPLDPLLYFSASLFLLGTGMLFLRLQPYLIRGLFALQKKFLKPAGYASYLQAIRTGTKQQFIMLFVVLTVSLGIFNATVARTIIANAENNTVYLSGANLVVQEYWKNNEAYVAKEPSAELVYVEPDFGKYAGLAEVESYTRVYRTKVEFEVKKQDNDGGKRKNVITADLMAIRTNEFGSLVLGDKRLNEYHINEYLNVLSTNAEAVLVSDSFRTKQGMKLGDTITYTNSEGNSATGVIYGFFEYWADYVPTSVSAVDGELVTENNYMIVAHLSYVQEHYGVRPYQIWMKTKGNDVSFFYDWAEQNGYKYTMVEALQENLANIRTDTLFQGTNGILTLSFIIILLLCGAGYLIYWILSIRERELLFGILRAMGMRKEEILQMLFIEQVFCGIFSIIFGGIAGVIASRLYVPMIQVTYAAENQVLPQVLITNAADTGKLFAVIAVMLIVCIAVLVRNIAAMKITNALKLGED